MTFSQKNIEVWETICVPIQKSRGRVVRIVVSNLFTRTFSESIGSFTQEKYLIVVQNALGPSSMQAALIDIKSLTKKRGAVQMYSVCKII